MPFGFSSTGAVFTLHELTPALLVGSVVLLVSVAAVRLSTKSGLPSLLPGRAAPVTTLGPTSAPRRTPPSARYRTWC